MTVGRQNISCHRGEIHAPIVMISYNRPSFVRLSINNVALADGVGNHDIFMFIDGPKSEKDKIKQDEIFAIVESYKKQLPKLTIIRRNRNYGCRDNIVDAISTIITRYGKAIIIEDDILISKTFLDYMDEALDLYKNDKSIWSINAYQLPNLKIPVDYPYDVYLDPVNMCWGWGTWVDRWNQVDFALKDWEVERENPIVLSRLNRAGRHFLDMINAQYDGRLDTWDVQCLYHVVKNGLMSIEPKFQLSKNIGFDPMVGGVHHNIASPLFSRQRYYNFRPKLVPNLTHDMRIFEQFEWIKIPKNIYVRIYRKLQRVLAYLKPLNMQPRDM